MVLGVIIILAADVSNDVVGGLLAYSGGVYIQIGAAEAMSKVYINANTAKLRFGAILAFVLGCVAIGLVLLDHEHCIPAGSDAHAGHNH